MLIFSQQYVTIYTEYCLPGDTAQTHQDAEFFEGLAIWIQLTLHMVDLSLPFLQRLS